VRAAEEHAVANAIIHLMLGVVYREQDETTWSALERQGSAVRDHLATIGVDVVVDDTEGYAYLQSRVEVDGEVPLPRLVKRRALISLLLVLLRKRLVEFETSGSEEKLVLSRDQIVELLRLFVADSTNEARVIDQVDSTIRKVAELGFLRQLRGRGDQWEGAEDERKRLLAGSSALAEIEARLSENSPDRFGARVRLEQERIDWTWAMARPTEQVA
jgi:hypothetical protein